MVADSPKRSPLKNAFVVLGVLVALILVIELGYRIASSQVLNEVRQGFGDHESRESDFSGQAFDDLFDESCLQSDIPIEFSEELLTMDAYEEVRFDSEKGLAGFWSDHEASIVQESIRNILLEKGWQEAPSNTPDLVSYVHREGRYRWALFSYSSSGTGTSVVLYYQ